MSEPGGVAESPRTAGAAPSTKPPELALSVVIPARNPGPDLLEQLDALAVQDFSGEWELILVDNASTDGSVARAQEYRGRITRLQVVDASEQPGQAHANNTGAHRALGRSLIFLDSDDVVEPGYLTAMELALRDHPFVASRLDCLSLNPAWLYDSRPPTQVEGVGTPFGFLPSAAGCSLGIWRSVFEEVGGFDSSIMLGNDVDFCWRVQLASYPLEFVPEAVISYRYRSSLRAIFNQARTYGTAGPVLYRRYGNRGMPKRSWRTATRFHLAPFVRLTHVRSKSGRAEAAFLFGFRLGILQGCLKNRVLYL